MRVWVHPFVHLSLLGFSLPCWIFWCCCLLHGACCSVSPCPSAPVKSALSWDSFLLCSWCCLLLQPSLSLLCCSLSLPPQTLASSSSLPASAVQALFLPALPFPGARLPPFTHLPPSQPFSARDAWSRPGPVILRAACGAALLGATLLQASSSLREPSGQSVDCPS